jgi:hypothetical protein
VKFNKLTQEGGIEEYVERFEELKSLMHSLNSLLPESYYISSFISGLKEDIKPMSKILKSVKLMTTFDQAKWQKESNSVLAKKNKFMPRPAALGRPIGNLQTNYVNDNQERKKFQTPCMSRGEGWDNVSSVGTSSYQSTNAVLKDYT